MAYGRLDVFWPDGKFESYLLDTPSTSIGRSSGSTIVLDTETISRYHVSMTANDEGLLELADMDSANGTFVDGVQLKNNETRVLRGGEELQIGHLRMIYHRMDLDLTLQMETMDEDTQRFVREDMGVRMDVYGPEIAVPPGSHTSVELSIFNDTPDAKRLTVRVNGLPEGWARINRPELEIDGESSAPVLINIKPLIHSDSRPGDYTMTIVVGLKDKPDQQIEGRITVRILPYLGFGVALGSTEVTAYEPFRLHVHNQGSIGIPIIVMGRSKDNMVRFVVRQPQMILAPGQRHVVEGEILPVRRRIFGPEREYSFDLMVRSRDDASFLAAVPGKYIESPILPTWAVSAMAVMAGAVFILLGLAVFLLLQVTPDPEITDFRAVTNPVTRGEILTLNWDITDAETVNILVDDVPLASDIPAEDGTVDIDTTLLDSLVTGEIILELQAINDDKLAITTASVILAEPLVVESYEIMPTTMARNVVQTLSGRWRVAGATETRVEGLQALGPVAVETSFGPEGSFEVSGLPTESFTVILVAQDERDNVLTQSIDITLIDPVCTSTVEGLELLAAPDETANVISTLELGQALIVDAQSADGQWLRIQREGVRAWGLRGNLRCEESFDPANLFVDPETVPRPAETTPEATIPAAEATAEVTPDR